MLTDSTEAACSTPSQCMPEHAPVYVAEASEHAGLAILPVCGFACCNADSGATANALALPTARDLNRALYTLTDAELKALPLGTRVQAEHSATSYAVLTADGWRYGSDGRGGYYAAIAVEVLLRVGPWGPYRIVRVGISPADDMAGPALDFSAAASSPVRVPLQGAKPPRHFGPNARTRALRGSGGAR